MADPVFFLLLLAFLFITATSRGQNNISLSDILTPTSNPSWLSSSGAFAFGFYRRGDGYYVGVFLPGTPNKTAVRTYYRDDPPLPSNSTLRFDSSGGLVLQSAQAKDRYVARPSVTTASASMLDSGNFVLYNSNQDVIWQSFDSPTDTILGGQRLSASQELSQKLYSSASLTNPSTGLFLAIMQLDGVLALYPIGKPFTAEYGYWDSGTPNNGPDVTLHLEEDGFLYLMKPSGEYLRNFTSQGNPKEDMIYRMTIDPDGLLRLYSYNITGKDDWSVEWLAPTVGEDRRNVSGQKEKHKHTRRDILIAVASSVAFAIVMLAVSGIIVHKNCARVHVRLPKEGNTRTIDNVSLRLFTYEELKKVTNDFAERIGKGAFGTVYKGMLSKSLEVVAVKKLENIATDGDSEFQNEVMIIGRTHHRNLVKLLGYCLDGDHRLLVYEYMSNGSLADLLFVPERRPLGDEKMGIAQNIARGLLYLHEECETQIIHCDIKPQNILIDEHKQAKISDFGLSKLLKPDQSNTMTRIRGTRGYVAPEWHKNLRVTVKADVYSFGIMLLEIICCRRNVDWTLPDEEAVLEEWVYNHFRAGELEKLVDDEFMDRKQLERMVKVGLWCIQEEPSLRPSMKKVLLMLEGTMDIPIPPCPSSIVSAI